MAQAETVRYKAAATHGITGDDIDLIGSGDEDTVMSARHGWKLLADSRELAGLRRRSAPAGWPVPNRPEAALHPVDLKPSAKDEVALS